MAAPSGSVRTARAFIAFTPLLRGIAGMFVGLFLIIFGLNMLGLFAPLRQFRFGLPSPVQGLVEKETHKRRYTVLVGDTLPPAPLELRERSREAEFGAWRRERRDLSMVIDPGDSLRRFIYDRSQGGQPTAGA